VSLVRSLRRLRTSPADDRLLPDGRMAGPMPWVIAIMIFLTALASAAGLSLAATARGLDADLAGRLTIQVIDPSAERRNRHVVALQKELVQLAAIDTVTTLPDAEVSAMLKPWFGDGQIGDDLPVPALIDVTLKRTQPGDIEEVRAAVRLISASARVDEHAQWLAPLAKLLGSLKWIAGMLVILMAVAMAATVVLVTRAALNSHRQTIEVLHLLGSSDAQVATLFQRRIALDALIGGLIGLGTALVTILVLSYRFSALGSDLANSYGPGLSGWLLIFILPLLCAVLATGVARWTVLTALRRML
jgi:cell division transport system permease protein